MRWLAITMLAACNFSAPSSAEDAAVEPPDAVAPDGAELPACGTRGGARGLSRREVTLGGLRRTYLVYLPDRSPADPLPLVFVHHGYTMSGQAMHEITEYAALAEAEGIAIAFPDGQGGPNSSGAPWNVGSGVCPSNFGPPPIAMGDDFALLDHVKADLDQDQCIDRDHVFVTGFSMGGYFSHHAGCMRPDVRAVAPHSGGTHPLDDCAAPGKPIIIFHGSADGLVPPGCNDPQARQITNVTPAADAWAARNGCSLTTTERAVTGGTCRSYDDCPAGRQVELCTFPAMGHCWAGGAASAGIYSCPLRASATRLSWEFFKTHAW
jgi:polyhydroxybutyrate depolymerase